MADFKNIPFKYVKITGGSSTIDVTMDNVKFLANKPNGYYGCFTFPKSDFGEVDYDDLKSLVNEEMTFTWDRTNRNTILLYNEETNEFICNINAYMGLKDSDLKTDGEIPHSGQAGWFEMELSTTKPSSIITLKQVDGSDIYLKIKDPVFDKTSKGSSKGNVCVEHTKKLVNPSSILIKNNALWSKSPEDNSALIVNINNPPSSYLSDFAGNITSKYLASNKILGFSGSSGILSGNKQFQAISYGKPVFSFIDTTDQSLTPVSDFFNQIYIKNTTGKDFVQYTETSDLNDILTSNQYVTFFIRLNNKNTFGKKEKETNRLFKGIRYYGSPGLTIYGFANINFTLTSISKPSVDGINFSLMSIDPKNKPFLYNPSNDMLTMIGCEYVNNRKTYIDINSFAANIPDGFIAIFVYAKSFSTANIIRIKKGDTIKEKFIKNNNGYQVEITGATGFGTELYFNTNTKPTPVSITKDDLINATGFTDIVADTKYPLNSDIITIYKI